jgi:hypothetical protein
MNGHTSACDRCGGIMVETYADLISPSEIGGAVILWRCVNCGDYVDRQILLNRTEQGKAPHLPPGHVQPQAIPPRARPIHVHRHIHERATTPQL